MRPRDSSTILIAVILLMVAIGMVVGIGWFAIARGVVTVDCSLIRGECGMGING